MGVDDVSPHEQPVHKRYRNKGIDKTLTFISSSYSDRARGVHVLAHFAYGKKTKINP